MWPFSRRLASDRQVIELLRDVTGRVERLENQHLSLRGYVYAKKGNVGPPNIAPPGAASGPTPTSTAAQPRLSRDELRALAGLKPGRAYPHPPDPPET
jgi:hypothetical protein